MNNDAAYYLDSNAVMKLWDIWTKLQGEGHTGDDIMATPFGSAVISHYTLDECLTFDLSKSKQAINSYKKTRRCIPHIPKYQAIETNNYIRERPRFA